jgi:hypothetical protein
MVNGRAFPVRIRKTKYPNVRCSFGQALVCAL